MAEAGAAPESLDSLIEPIRASAQVPALALAVVRGSSLVGIGATGQRQAGATNPVRPGDCFHLGSNTKAMTATLLAVLVEQDQSGLPDDRAPDPTLWPQIRGLSGPIVEQRRRLVELVLSRTPSAPAGSQFLYSNAGYTIAGAMAEAVTGQSWEELMTRHIFKPLGMPSAGFGPPGSPGATDQPWGHTIDGCRPVPPGPTADNPPVIGPAGTVNSTLADWAAFASLHLRGCTALDWGTMPTDGSLCSGRGLAARP